MDTTEIAQDLPQPPLWQRLASFGNGALLWVGSGVLMLMLMLAAKASGVVAPLLWAAIGLALLASLSLFIHEAGHIVAARMAGMHPVEMWLGPVRLLRRRRGWRAVRAPPGESMLMAIAYPSSGRGLRRQLTAFTLGGPLANLVVAAVLCAAALLIGGVAGDVMLGVAAFNAGLGLANLMPFKERLSSDGMLLLDLLKGIDEDAPDWTFARLNGMSLDGITADRLPAELVDRLADADAPMPLIHLWFRLKALQNQGQWAEAVALAPVLEARAAALPEPLQSAMADLVAQLRTEIGFSAAMLGERPEAPLDAGITRLVEQLAPMLRPRCLALQAILDGQHGDARTHIAQARALAEDSFDAALRTSERMIREALEARLDGTPPTRAHLPGAPL